MPLITEVRFGHEHGALADTLAALPELDARVVRDSSTNPDESVYHLRLDHPAPDRVQAALEADHTVANATPKPEFDTEPLAAVKFADDAVLMGPHVTSLDGLVVDARSASPEYDPRGWHERWLLPSREAIHEVWQRARDDGFTFSLLEFRPAGRTDGTTWGIDVLTEEQRETLAAAYEAGYFTEPRETSLEELGESLGLSASAVGGRLKRAMKALIGETLAVERYDG
ncbi:MAG: helix-turn-helix domain-containing protein [Salinirussus sp.]